MKSKFHQLYEPLDNKVMCACTIYSFSNISFGAFSDMRLRMVWLKLEVKVQQKKKAINQHEITEQDKDTLQYLKNV